MVIRPFQSDDAEPCFNILRECIRTDSRVSAFLQRKLLESESAALMRERAGLFYIAVCESDGEITGLGGLDLNEIRLLFVSPAHRRNGIGRAILTHLEAMVPSELFMDIFVYAAPGAAGFYRSLGYRAQGETVFDLKGVPISTVFMTKDTR